ncbi:MAG: hypothetical protein L6245_03165, partial [Thermodesulfovibrionales bacterium]|nr:hypothetical protein [Thermodesulfovibrionales bacterium]
LMNHSFDNPSLSCRSQLVLTHLYHKKFSVLTISLLLLSITRINSLPAPFAKAIMVFNHFALGGAVAVAFKLYLAADVIIKILLGKLCLVTMSGFFVWYSTPS